MQTSRYLKVLPNVISFIENIKDTCCLRAFVCIVILTIACMHGCRNFRHGKCVCVCVCGGGDNCLRVQLLLEGGQDQYFYGNIYKMSKYTCSNMLFSRGGWGRAVQITRAPSGTEHGMVDVFFKDNTR